MRCVRFTATFSSAVCPMHLSSPSLRRPPLGLRVLLGGALLEHRLLYPPDAAIELHMVIEQHPVRENRILLSPERRDIFCQPLAAINWGVSPEDEAALTRSTELFYNFWAASPLARLGEIELRPPTAAASELAKSGGIYHPSGSARMGHSPTDGLVDGAFRVFRIPNLSLVSTAAFPTGGGANPTMMLMMAALRTADRLAGRAVLSIRYSLSVVVRPRPFRRASLCCVDRSSRHRINGHPANSRCRDEIEGQQERLPVRRPYRRPELRIFGKVLHLTQGSGRHGHDWRGHGTHP